MKNKKEMGEFGQWYADGVNAKLAQIEKELKKSGILTESDFA